MPVWQHLGVNYPSVQAAEETPMNEEANRFPDTVYLTHDPKRPLCVKFEKGWMVLEDERRYPNNLGEDKKPPIISAIHPVELRILDQDSEDRERGEIVFEVLFREYVGIRACRVDESYLDAGSIPAPRRIVDSPIVLADFIRHCWRETILPAMGVKILHYTDPGERETRKNSSREPRLILVVKQRYASQIACAIRKHSTVNIFSEWEHAEHFYKK
jgi:hypothetical protein